MYRVLIVDDELPALRYIQSIIEKYTPYYQVVDACSSGEQAQSVLSSQSVDLLITDINMHGINGIELSKQARLDIRDIHILIISGYGEFEYAQGAIQAGVDDYILKPVSVNKMVSALESIRKKLDAERLKQACALLPSIACGKHYTKEVIQRLFNGRQFRFALTRWGNLDMTEPKALTATSIVYPLNERFLALRGRSDTERVLLYASDNLDAFLTDLSVYITQPGQMVTWTAVYSESVLTIDKLPAFITDAMNMMYYKAVIGKHQILQLTVIKNTPERRKLPAADIKQLGYFISSEKTRMIKDFFISLAIEWEHAQLSQRDVYHLSRQLIHQIAAIYPPVYNRIDDILLEFNELINCANSYGELMSNVYSLLFENGSIRDKKLSTKELYDYTVQYISNNFAQPLNMQSVCVAIGISQTYLSRLFRKYSDVTFNTFLTQCRMEAAKKLLREKPDLLLRDVAACVGYEDSSYFTKVFHQYTGLTPSQFASGEGN